MRFHLFEVRTGGEYTIEEYLKLLKKVIKNTGLLLRPRYIQHNQYYCGIAFIEEDLADIFYNAINQLPGIQIPPSYRNVEFSQDIVEFFRPKVERSEPNQPSQSEINPTPQGTDKYLKTIEQALTKLDVEKFKATPIPYSFSEAFESGCHIKFLRILACIGHDKKKRLVAELESIMPKSESRSYLRNLLLLGKIGFDQGFREWSCMPKTLIRIDEDQYFFAGQLAAQEEWKLFGDKDVSLTRQPSESPPRISIRLDSNVLESNVLSANNWAIIDNSIKIAEQLPSIEDFIKSCNLLRKEAFHDWQFRKYNIEKNCWEKKENFNQYVRHNDGFYEFSREQPYKEIFCVYVESDCFINCDWYGMRWLALRNSKKNLSCYWIRSSAQPDNIGSLIIPQNYRWPQIYERALVLQTGMLPFEYTDSNIKLIIYSNLSRDCADTITKKLNIQLQNVEQNEGAFHA